MKYYFIFFIFLIFCTGSIAQMRYSLDDNKVIFKIYLDSIERKIIINKWEADTSYYLHYKVENSSKDTLTYVTNGCFYYNHYSLKGGGIEFDLNPIGSCSFNDEHPHLIAPGKSFNMSEWITGVNLNMLTKGKRDVKLEVPIVKDNNTTYRIDGRANVDNVTHLIFEGYTKMMESQTLQ